MKCKSCNNPNKESDMVLCVKCGENFCEFCSVKTSSKDFVCNSCLILYKKLKTPK